MVLNILNEHDVKCSELQKNSIIIINNIVLLGLLFLEWQRKIFLVGILLLKINKKNWKSFLFLRLDGLEIFFFSSRSAI